MEIFILFASAIIFVSMPVCSLVITTNNGVIQCDGITCPANSVSCTVSKKTSDDLMVYQYSRTCFDASGVATQTVQETLPNPYPETLIDSISTVGGSSSSSSIGTLNDEQQQKLNSILESQDKYWEQWQSGFNAKMQNIFRPGFPFK